MTPAGWPGIRRDAATASRLIDDEHCRSEPTTGSLHRRIRRGNARVEIDEGVRDLDDQLIDARVEEAGEVGT